MRRSRSWLFPRDLFRGSAWRIASVVLAILLEAGLAQAQAQAQEMTADEAEAFVRTRWFEGMPEAEALRISQVGAARLMALLDDPEESVVHANALLALAISGAPGAFDAIAAWADRPRSGEVDRGTFRAWQALPFALRHAAEYDGRAIARLAARLDRKPGFRFRHHSPERLERLSKRAAVNALAEVDHPVARAALARARAEARDIELRLHIDEATSPRRFGVEEVGR